MTSYNASQVFNHFTGPCQTTFSVCVGSTVSRSASGQTNVPNLMHLFTLLLTTSFRPFHPFHVLACVDKSLALVQAQCNNCKLLAKKPTRRLCILPHCRVFFSSPNKRKGFIPTFCRNCLCKILTNISTDAIIQTALSSFCNCNFLLILMYSFKIKFKVNFKFKFFWNLFDNKK